MEGLEHDETAKLLYAPDGPVRRIRIPLTA
jgi:hypothetical protein